VRLSIVQARALNIDERIIRLAEQDGVATKFLDAELKAEPPKPKRAKPADGYDSKLERDFAECLKRAEREQWIKRWWHHPWRFRLAPKCYYQVDAMVEPFYPDDYLLPRLVCIEVKGGWFRDDAKVKVKVAAEMFPCFQWLLVFREKYHDWDVREVTSRGIGREPIRVPWIQ
jgi:hypothetical protein